MGYCGMSTKFTVVPGQRLVVLTFDGPTDVPELERIGSLILAHPDFEPSFSQIIDCSGVTGVNFSPDTIREVIRGEKTFSPTSKRVIIAPQDHIYGLARMAQAFAEKTLPNLMVVRSMAEALEVLGEVK